MAYSGMPASGAECGSRQVLARSIHRGVRQVVADDHHVERRRDAAFEAARQHDRDQIVGDVIHVEHRRDPAIVAGGHDDGRHLIEQRAIQHGCIQPVGYAIADLPAIQRDLAGAEGAAPRAPDHDDILDEAGRRQLAKPVAHACGGTVNVEEIDGRQPRVQLREAPVELGRQADGRRLEVLPRPHLLEAAQFAEPPVLQDRERRKQHADHRDQGCKKQDLAGWARLTIWFVQNLSAAVSSTDLLSIHLPTVSHELLNFNLFVCYLPYYTAHGRQVYERR